MIIVVASVDSLLLELMHGGNSGVDI